MKLTGIEEFGRAFIPKNIRPKLRSYLLKAGIQEVPYKQYGWLFILSIIITGILYIGLFFPYLKDYGPLTFMVLTAIIWFILQIVMLILVMAILYIKYDLHIINRTRKIEDVLEEFLRYVSENLKAGMPFEKALWEAIRPQFGVLAEEIRLVAKKVMTGQDTTEALQEFTEKYDSPILKRSFQLIIEGIKGGGEIAYLIDKIEQDIRETKELKQEINATNTTYVIFLTLIVIVITPILFALSYNLLLVLKGLAGKISSAAGSSSALPFDLSKVNIKEGNFETFSTFALAIVATFSSMIVSIIRKGNIKEGLKYIPIFIASSLLMYTIFKGILTAVFKSFIGL